MRTLSVLLLCLAAMACDAGSATPTSTPSTTTTSTSTTTATTTTTVTADNAVGGAVDCGEDFSSLDQVGPPSVARLCFLDANAASKPATLTIHEVRATGEFTALLRSNADRTIDVVSADGALTSTCAGLAPDDRRVFRLAGCDPPLPGD